MSFIYVFGIFAISAYIFQAILGFKQIKHFTAVYSEMKSKGRVAIGRRAGKFRAGTIVMFTLNQEEVIIDARKIQGTTVLAKFKALTDFEGVKIGDLSLELDCVSKENKLTQGTIMNALETYRRVMSGEVITEPVKPLAQLAPQFQLLKYKIQTKLQRSESK